MIICRKPWTIYDVDAVGAAGVVVFVLAAAWLVVGPWQRTWDSYRRLTGARTAVCVKLHDDLAKLERVEQGARDMEQAVADQLACAPNADSYSRLLSRITDLAKESQLELLSVTPQLATASGAYLVSDIQIGGRGRSQDFVLFLDRLAQENPYQSLYACSISRAPTATEPRCDLAWTIRMYLLPAASEGRAGGGA